MELDARFNNIKYLVKADRFSRFLLWKQHHDTIDWKEDLILISYKIGYLTGDDRPVWCTFRFDTVNNQPICFYDSESTLVDWDMVDKWIENNIKCKKKISVAEFEM